MADQKYRVKSRIQGLTFDSKKKTPSVHEAGATVSLDPADPETKTLLDKGVIVHLVEKDEEETSEKIPEDPPKP